jgi:ribonuclease E
MKCPLKYAIAIFARNTPNRTVGSRATGALWLKGLKTMGNKMLIDASQREETRVVVARGNRIEEFDFESAARKPLKGNIYLAKVTRVEPSLQAAFVDYGGNRHGFLAFAEIHPDYYQIPIADRLALLKEQEEDDAAFDDDDHDDHSDTKEQPDQHLPDAHDHQHDHDHHDHDDVHEAESEDAADVQHDAEPASDVAPLAAEPLPSLTADDHASVEVESEVPANSANGEIVSIEENVEDRGIESVGAEDALEEVPQRPRRAPRRRQYKIQEVIKRRQILLVQVVKEERGNKGAALTTYLSLAGRYCVLMPNTARGGGISRKITDAGDRRRLKEVARDVEVPQGMGLIVRTAGAQRTRPEIKRDFDYLLRLWESVRDLTLQSQAPCLVYEEGSLIKRSIRDLYTKDVDEVIVEGDEAYREAKDFMKMLMPSHAKNVKLYTENKPLFTRYQVESHLDALFSPSVTLPSGGYIVINQTEALVSIDINSGKATREHNIEDTAYKTNLEACDEIGRQLRLRDLAGLVVIDFIDMEENRNNRAVERRIKEALKNDRARIQVGRISHFGLLEMSRQRLRPGLLEGTFRTCPHCEGRGMVRSVSSCGLGVLRQIEDQLLKRVENLTVTCAREVAYYLLNEKRDSLLVLEQTYGITIFVVPSLHEMKGTQAVIERANDRENTPRRITTAAPVRMESALNEEFEEEFVEEVEDETVEAEAATDVSPQEDREQTGEGNGRKRRRRGRRGGRRGERENDENGEKVASEESSEDAEEGVGAEGETEATSTEGENDVDAGNGNTRENRPRRGRRDRYGRQRGRRDEKPVQADADAAPREDAPMDAQPASADDGEAVVDQPPREPRGERPPREQRGDRPPREGRDNRRERGPRGDRPPRENHIVAPAEPAFKLDIPDVIAEPEPRKWTPPAPTIQAEAAPKKGGWWNRLKG